MFYLWGKLKRSIMKEDVKLVGQITLVCVGVILVIATLWNTTAYRDIDSLKIAAPKFIKERGFTITSYDGYEGAMIHGGFVWYQVRDNNDYLYNMAIGDWRGELMLYNQKCLNAVTNK